MKAALVLEAVLADEPLDLFVLFSSVSSILGLPGQADYTAANAFLDAMAHARGATRRGPHAVPSTGTPGRASACWRTMCAASDEQEEQAARGAARIAAHPGGHPALEEVLSDDAAATVFRTMFSRDRSWLLSEHVVRGGDALLSGTSMLEIARAALQHNPDTRSAELRDVFFVGPSACCPVPSAPCMYASNAVAKARSRMYGDTEQEEFVVGKARLCRRSHPPPAWTWMPSAHVAPPAAWWRMASSSSTSWISARAGAAPRGSTSATARHWSASNCRPRSPADLAHFKLHPAMLDLATGGAQAIVPGFDPNGTFYVPLAYGRVLIRRPMPARVFSHVRLRDATSKDSVAFDATLVDERGEEIASIENFMMRRVSGAFRQEGSGSTSHAPAARAQRTGRKHLPKRPCAPA